MGPGLDGWMDFLGHHQTCCQQLINRILGVLSFFPSLFLCVSTSVSHIHAGDELQ